MSGPELPVIYENPRFDKATPTLKPVFDRAMRAGLVLMLEWGTLTVLESSPAYLKWATIIVAVLGLSVHESWPWLRMRDRRWYPSLMGVLIVSYLLICFYGYTTPVQKALSHSQAVGLFNEAIPKPPQPARSKETIKELLQESASIQSIIQTGLPLANQWRTSITVLNPDRLCLDLNIHAFDERITPIENGLDAAQAALASVLARNRIDSAEFAKIFGSSGEGSSGFSTAAQELRGYRDAINQLGNHPACDSLMRSNSALFQFVDMLNGLNQYSTWIAKSKDSVDRYRDGLRKELRNAP